MPYIRSTCRAGRTKEVAKYYTRKYKPKEVKRAKKEKVTSERQREINNRCLVRKLTRILNANFDSTSWYVTFSYTKEKRPNIEELQRHKKDLLKKLRKCYKESGTVLKYVETAEVGERGAVHIHAVINDIDIRKVKEIWQYGYITAKPLDDTGQYRKLAEYFVKYFQKTKGTAEQLQKKAYNCSRNLIRPEPKKKVIHNQYFKNEIYVPEGWYLDKESVRSGITADGYEFLYYTLIQILPVSKRLIA